MVELFNILKSSAENPISFSVLIVAIVVIIFLLIKYNKIGTIKKIAFFELDSGEKGVSVVEAISTFENAFKDYLTEHLKIISDSNEERQHLKRTAIERTSNVFNIALIDSDDKKIENKMKEYLEKGIRLEEILKMYILMTLNENLMLLFNKMDKSIELRNSANEQMLAILDKYAIDVVNSIISSCRKFPIDNEISFLTDFVTTLKESLKSSIIDMSMSYVRASRDEQVSIQSLVEKRTKIISDKLSELSNASKKKK